MSSAVSGVQNAVVFYSYGVGCRWLASKDSTRTTSKEPLKLWQVYAAGIHHSDICRPYCHSNHCSVLQQILAVRWFFCVTATTSLQLRPVIVSCSFFQCIQAATCHQLYSLDHGSMLLHALLYRQANRTQCSWNITH